MIGNGQFGFKSECGSREALGIMRLMSKRVLEGDEEKFFCFIFFNSEKKTFYGLQWKKFVYEPNRESSGCWRRIRPWRD